MPAAAIPTWALITSAVAPAAASVAGAAMQSRAAGRASREQTQGATYAADRQLEASRETERFQRQQAQATWQQQEADRRANYEQWVVRERRLGSIAEALGYGRREIPGYVPSANPGFAEAAPPFQPGTPQHAQWYRDTQMGQPSPLRPSDTGGTQGQAGHITRGGTVPMEIAGAGVPPPPPSARDAILARRFPQGSVGAMVLARQRRPMGAGV